MIFDILFLLAGSLAFAVQKVFALITFVVPDVWEDALFQFFESVGVLQGVLPIVADPNISGVAGDVGIMDVVLWFINFTIAWFTFKLALRILRLIPIFKMDFGDLERTSYTEGWSDGSSRGSYTESSTRSRIFKRRR